MLQESVSNEEQILVLSWETTLMDDEETFIMVGFIEILLWIDFKDIVTHLESNRLNLWGDVLARISHMAECLIGSAIEVWESSCPLILDLVKHIRWDGELRATSINYGWV